MDLPGPSEAELLLSSSKLHPSYSIKDGKHLGTGKFKLVVISILVVELCERLTYYGLSANLVIYCTNELQFTTVDATTVQLVFSGTCYFLPLFGGWIADSIAGQYNAILASTMLYALGTILLPVASYDYQETFGTNDADEKVSLNQAGQTAYFMTGLSLVAIATGGMKANVSPFGAHQLEDMGSEYIQSFFNWFYWFINVGSALAFTFVAYVQQNVIILGDFFLGYLMLALPMVLATIIFLIPRKQYRNRNPCGSVISKVFSIVVEAMKQRKAMNANQKLQFMDYAKIQHGGKYSESDVEGVKSLSCVIPVFLTFIVYWTVHAQMQTSCLLQGVHMNLGYKAWIPAASLNVFNTLVILILVPFLGKLYPMLSKYRIVFSQLQKIGMGMVFAALSMVAAGIVEIYRKHDCCTHTQEISGTYYQASDLSVFWQIPQFMLIGVSEVFSCATGLEYAYSQSPTYIKGLVMGLFLMMTALGKYLGTALNYAVKSISGNKNPWLPDDINKGYLEYYFFMLAVLMSVNFLVFLMISWWLHSSNKQDSGDNSNGYVTLDSDQMDDDANITRVKQAAAEHEL